MKISLSGRIIEVGYKYCQMTVPEFMRFAAGIGYDAVELRATQISHETSLAKTAMYAETAQKLGLDVSCINMSGIGLDEEGFARFKRYVEHAETLKCKYLKTWILDENLIKKMCDYASGLDLKIVAQTHVGGPLETVDSIIRTLERVDRENFGVIYDAANLLIAGEDYGANTIRKIGKKIFQVSIQSVRRARTKEVEGVMEFRGFYYERCLIGEEGGIDFLEVFKGLKEVGFDGYITVIEPISNVMDNRELARYAFNKVRELLRRSGY